MTNRKIEIITDNFYPAVGGGSFDILTVHSKLAARGWDIIVHTTRNTYTQRNVLPDQEEINLISIRRYINKFYGYFPKINLFDAEYIVLNNFNILPHFYVFLRAAWMQITGARKFKIILVPYTGFTPIWTAFSKPTAFVKWLYHVTFGLFFVNYVVDGIRAISEWERQLLLKAGVTTRIEIIQCGLEDEAYGDIEGKATLETKSLVKSLGSYAVQIGRIHRLKNYDVAIRAVARVPDVKLVIVGPDQDKQYKIELLQLIQDLKIGDRVVFTGVIPIYDKFYLLKNSAMALHTSLFEGFGIAVFEAMSQGCVCIVAKNTAVDELIKNGVNGYLADPHDHMEFAQHISYVLDKDNSTEIKQIVDNNIGATRGKSWDDIATQVEVFYESTNRKV